jgi:integrase
VSEVATPSERDVCCHLSRHCRPSEAEGNQAGRRTTRAPPVHCELSQTLDAPTTVNVIVKSSRPREYLTEKEIERLMDAVRRNRHGHRDATAILLAYRHVLRASELITVRWDDIDLTTGRLHVRRSKGGEAAVHPLGGKDLRALRRLQREAVVRSVYVFISERGAPLTVAGYQRMVARAGKAARFQFLIHSHMLRHSTGYKLANVQFGRLIAEETEKWGKVVRAANIKPV